MPIRLGRGQYVRWIENRRAPEVNGNVKRRTILQPIRRLEAAQLRRLGGFLFLGRRYVTTPVTVVLPKILSPNFRKKPHRAGLVLFTRFVKTPVTVVLPKVLTPNHRKKPYRAGLVLFTRFTRTPVTVVLPKPLVPVVGVNPGRPGLVLFTRFTRTPVTVVLPKVLEAHVGHKKTRRAVQVFTRRIPDEALPPETHSPYRVLTAVFPRAKRPGLVLFTRFTRTPVTEVLPRKTPAHRPDLRRSPAVVIFTRFVRTPVTEVLPRKTPVYRQDLRRRPGVVVLRERPREAVAAPPRITAFLVALAFLPRRYRPRGGGVQAIRFRPGEPPAPPQEGIYIPVIRPRRRHGG